MNASDEIREGIAGTLIDACCGYHSAVATVVSTSRALWAHVHSPGMPEPERSSSRYRSLGENLVEVLSEQIPPSRAVAVCHAMTISGVLEHRQNSSVRLRKEAFDPRALVRALLGGTRTDAHLRYATMRSIRAHFALPLSAGTLHYFDWLSQAINSILSKDAADANGVSIGLAELDELKTRLVTKAQRENAAAGSGEAIRLASSALLECFLEVCRAVGYLSIAARCSQVRFRTRAIDNEYLISNLFGIPTDIAGLDQVFGGGGLVLPEVEAQPLSDPLGLYRQVLPARIVVVVGSRGTGKSIFAMQLAAEVAARGGVSWLMPLEQSPEECLFTLQTVGSLRSSGISVATEFSSAATALEQWHCDRGALLILRPEDRSVSSSEPQQSRARGELEALNDFLALVSGTAASLSRGNVRLVIVDPLNSRVPEVGPSHDQRRLRDMLRHAIQEIKRSGTNVLLVVEEQELSSLNGLGREASGHELAFAENLADIIIRLSISKRHNYAHRLLEVKKSRTQREQRGDHTFSIRPGQGLRIVPSVASVNAKIRNRRPLTPVDDTHFGVRCVEESVGPRGLRRGDVIVFRGPGGCFKTQLGLAFLLSTNRGEMGLKQGKVSLLFSARDGLETVRELLQRACADTSHSLASFVGRSPTESLRIIEIPRGHLLPGMVLQIIEDECQRLILDGKSLHRIMIDNISLWEVCSPEIADDATFPVTLVNLLRGHQCTCLLVCGPTTEARPGLQRSLAGMADCLTQFERYEFRGASRVMMRVLKSRGMEHRLDAFEVRSENGRIVARPSTSLLRMSNQGGKVEPIPIRLLLRTDSELQRNYYFALRDSLRAMVSRQTTLENLDGVVLARTSVMDQVSAVDELQVLELDEFQIGSMDRIGAQPVLHLFREETGRLSRWEEYLPRFVRKCTSYDPASSHRTDFYRALPFFSNVSLLAFDPRRTTADALSSWARIAEECWNWEQVHGKGVGRDKAVFFEHPRGSAENFNCLFLEILLSLIEQPQAAVASCPLRSWLTSEAAKRAGAYMRIVCRRSYRLGRGDSDALEWQAGHSRSMAVSSTRRVFPVSIDAIVYRHWYSTLNEMLMQMHQHHEQRRTARKLRVGALPEKVAVSGEWYLGIPSFSAAPYAGASLIEEICTPDAELTRVRLGVGLPTRKSYYDSVSGRKRLPVSPYFEMDGDTIRDLVTGAFSRANFLCYAQVSPILADHLKRLIEAPSRRAVKFGDALVESESIAEDSMSSLCAELDFVQLGEEHDRVAHTGCECDRWRECSRNVIQGLRQLRGFDCPTSERGSDNSNRAPST